MVVADTVTGAPAAADRAASASARRGPRRGRLPITCTETLPTSKSGGPHPSRGLAQQGHAARAGPRRVRRTEVGAEVAQSGGGEQRVARRVGRDVGVGVTLEPLRLVGPVQAGEVERYAVDEAVDVGSDADSGECLHTMIMPERESAA